MQVNFRKRRDGGSCATIERDDGLSLRLWSYDRTGVVPHDAVHLIGERALGLPEGLWGSIAAGAVFDSIEVVEGRLRHDWRRRSEEVRRHNAEQLALAESVVGVLQHCIDHDGAAVKSALDRAWGITHTGGSPFTSQQAGVAVAQLRDLRSRWRDLSGDDAVTCTWPLPLRTTRGGKRPPRGR